MKEQEDDVLYLEAVAYQRKDVDDEFFEEFPPNFTTSDFTKVKRILDLTYPEAKSTFHQGFIDLWDNERSVLVVSW